MGVIFSALYIKLPSNLVPYKEDIRPEIITLISVYMKSNDLIYKTINSIKITENSQHVFQNVFNLQQTV